MRIVCNGISKDFTSNNKRLEALKDITVETEGHDFVCILGPNGCGKTTLLKIMAGILRPSHGNIAYEGSNNDFNPASLIFQERELFPWLNVVDNVCFYLEMKGFSEKERHKRAVEYIQKMGLSEFVDYYPHQLSAGMKQKVNLIRGLLTDSPILLIDEPVASLDIYAKLVIHEDIYKIWHEYEKTIIYVTHDIETALRIARHIWIMGKAPGRIIKRFDIDSLKSANPKNKNFDNQLIDLKNQIISIIQEEAARMST